VRIVYLRKLLEAGFCGTFFSKHEEDKSRGHSHLSLDKIILRGGLTHFTLESAIVQAGNEYCIPYEEKQYFDKCLLGLNEKRAIFESGSLEIAEVDSAVPGVEDVKIRHVVIRDKNTGVYVEPFYGFYSKSDFVPYFSLMGAYLSGHSGQISIRVVSVFGDMDQTETYASRAETLRDLLCGALEGHIKRPGWPCLACKVSGCQFSDPFEEMVHSWLKQKQALEQAEEKIREHLTMQGPTKCGVHTVHLKEHKRRFFNDAKFPEFLNLIMSLHPKDYMKYLTPDGSEIFKGVAKGELPLEAAKLFKQSHYYTVEGNLSL
jgi:hypothetical protein